MNKKFNVIDGIEKKFLEDMKVGERFRKNSYAYPEEYYEIIGISRDCYRAICRELSTGDIKTFSLDTKVSYIEEVEEITEKPKDDATDNPSDLVRIETLNPKDWFIYEGKDYRFLFVSEEKDNSVLVNPSNGLCMYLDFGTMVIRIVKNSTKKYIRDLKPGDKFSSGSYQYKVNDEGKYIGWDCRSYISEDDEEIKILSDEEYIVPFHDREDYEPVYMKDFNDLEIGTVIHYPSLCNDMCFKVIKIKDRDESLCEELDKCLYFTSVNHKRSYSFLWDLLLDQNRKIGYIKKKNEYVEAKFKDVPDYTEFSKFLFTKNHSKSSIWKKIKEFEIDGQVYNTVVATKDEDRLTEFSPDQKIFVKSDTFPSIEEEYKKAEYVLFEREVCKISYERDLTCHKFFIKSLDGYLRLRVDQPLYIDPKDLHEVLRIIDISH